MDRKRHIAIFTTASLPWMTGTAVNPLFRAAYLTKDGDRKVTLVIPWLSLKDQELIYPNKVTFTSPSEHETYVRRWLEERTGFICGFNINFYPGKVIRLSAATQDLPSSIICNVHGVNPKFLEIGKKKQEQQREGTQAFTKGAYYIGKMVWSKGYRELLQLLANHQTQLTGLQVDLYGNGKDSDQVQEGAKKLDLAVNVHPGRDHADPLFHKYKVFLNPSTTDVVCTTTAEALAMGKVVICANHPSNEFFKQFPNCHTYDNSNGFVKLIRKALAEEPVPLTDSQMHELSWEIATERFLKAAGLDRPTVVKQSDIPREHFMSTSFRLPDFRRNMEDASAYLHYAASGFEPTRRVFGAIPGSLQPDDEQCRELGLRFHAGKHGSSN